MSIARLMQQAAAGGGGPIVGIPWDVSTAKFTGRPVSFFTVGYQEGTPQGLFFKPDGTRMYVIGSTNDVVAEYSLSEAWSLVSVTFVQSFSVSGQESNATGLFFKPDGTKMYVTGLSGSDVNEYDLSTAWDVSTASYLQNFSVSSQDISPSGISFKTDGTKMYVVGTGGDSVNEYDLSTAWDVSTASYLHNFSVSTQDASPQDLFFKPDGTKMYVVGSGTDFIYEYNLSTAWNISTASYVQGLNIQARDLLPTSVFFQDDGTSFFIVGVTNQTVYQYETSSAWNLSGASWTAPTSDYLDIRAQDDSPVGLFLKPDGTKLYVSGSDDDEVNEYNLSTAWELSSASYSQSFSLVVEDNNPRGLFFKPDGTKMYVIGSAGDDINEYNLSAAWDISSASYLQNFSVSTEDSAPFGLFFKPDGTKMYVIGGTGKDVNEYDLSTAWDISSASYLQNFSVVSDGSSPTGLFFKSDGTKMYVADSNVDSVNEYDLSTPWDISSASFLQDLRVATESVFTPTAIFFKSDGTKMYVAQSGGTRPTFILSYSLDYT